MYFELCKNKLQVKVKATNVRGRLKKICKSLSVLKEYMALKGYKNPSDKDCVRELEKLERRQYENSGK